MSGGLNETLSDKDKISSDNDSAFWWRIPTQEEIKKLNRWHLDVKSDPNLDTTIEQHNTGVKYPQIKYLEEELIDELSSSHIALWHYNEILRKQVVLIPKKLIMKIMDERLYWGNITLATNPELKIFFEELSRHLGISVDNIVIDCIDDRKPKTLSFWPRMPGWALLWYTQSTQLVAQFLEKIGIDPSEVYSIAWQQYKELWWLSWHVWEGWYEAISHGDHCKCGCWAIKSLLLYIDAIDGSTDIWKQEKVKMEPMMLFLKDIMNYNNKNKTEKPYLFPEYIWPHNTEWGMLEFKNIVFDKQDDSDWYMPYMIENKWVFWYNKILQRKFITTEFISLINKVLETKSISQRNILINKIEEINSLELNIDKSTGHIMLNEYNRSLLWNAIKEDFNIVNNIILTNAAKNVPAINIAYSNRATI